MTLGTIFCFSQENDFCVEFPKYLSSSIYFASTTYDPFFKPETVNVATPLSVTLVYSLPSTVMVILPVAPLSTFTVMTTSSPALISPTSMLIGLSNLDTLNEETLDTEP